MICDQTFDRIDDRISASDVGRRELIERLYELGYWIPLDEVRISAGLDPLRVHEILPYLEGYPITYVLNGGVNDARNPSMYTKIQDIEIYPAARTGYLFDGWTDQATGAVVSEIRAADGREGPITLIANWRTAVTGIIEEFQSDDTSKHGWKQGYISAKKGVVEPASFKFKPGVYGLTAIGGGGNGRADAKLIWWNAWSGYTAAGGSGSFLSGYVEVVPDVPDYSYGNVKIRVTARTSIGAWDYSRTGKYVADSCVSATGINCVAGGGWCGAGDADGTYSRGGPGGQVSATAGLGAEGRSGGVLTVPGNAGGHAHARPGWNPGAEGGAFAVPKFRYGGGVTMPNVFNQYKHPVYNPGHGFVHIKRIGDRMCTVVFKDGVDGSEITRGSYARWSRIVFPTPPSREGYRFSGWDRPSDFVVGDMTCTAQYEIYTYTVTFKGYDGTVLKTQIVNYGASATPPSAPPRAGYSFAGWSGTYTNVTSDQTVTATYSAVSYSITYNLDGGTNDPRNPASYTIESGGISFYDPSRDGWRFGGWTDSSGQPITGIAAGSTGNVSLTAQWTADL